jgi:acylphosphatase
MPQLHAIITGRVQGVNFRMAAVGQARRLGLKGWVRNNADRSVETVAAGAREALVKYMVWLREGPPGARVDQVAETWSDKAETFDAFNIRYDSDD